MSEVNPQLLLMLAQLIFMIGNIIRYNNLNKKAEKEYWERKNRED